jgi:hypothetical protein
MVSPSSSGPTASLLGCGVSCELFTGADSLSFRFVFRGELLSGSVVVELGVGVLEKKPCNVRWLAEEDCLFSVAGVGVDAGAFFAMLAWNRGV